MSELTTFFDSAAGIILTAFTGVVYAIGFAVAYFRLKRARENPTFRSRRIALVGPARVGKTTTVISVLDQIRRGRIYNGSARLRTEATIARVAQLSAILNDGGFPPSTREDETNIYRFDYAIRLSSIFRLIFTMIGIGTLYRVEVADFAGEQSERYFLPIPSLKADELPDDYGLNASHNFLKWISESDVCVVFIDCELYSTRGDEYVRSITEKYVTFWSFYMDVHSDIFLDKKAPPVVLLYSKGDVLLPTNRVDFTMQMMLEEQLNRAFRDLIVFLTANAASVSTVVSSAIARDTTSERLGVSELVHSILPRRGDF